MHTAILNLVFAAAFGQCAGADSAACSAAPCQADAKPTGGSCVCDWLGPMPQTCYGPRYGCYPGHNRYINRYPAFHGSYYRQPYNYQHWFEYPWHAAPHEPLPYLGGESAGVTGEVFGPAPVLPSTPAMPTAAVPTADSRGKIVAKSSRSTAAKSRQAVRADQEDSLRSLIE